MIYRFFVILVRALSRLSQGYSLLVLLNKADYSIVRRNLFGQLTLWTLQSDVSTEEKQLLDHFDVACPASGVQRRSVQRRHQVDLCALAEQKQLNDRRLRTTDSDVQSRHLSVVGEHVRVVLVIEDQELDYPCRFVFDR